MHVVVQNECSLATPYRDTEAVVNVDEAKNRCDQRDCFALSYPTSTRQGQRLANLASHANFRIVSVTVPITVGFEVLLSYVLWMYELKLCQVLVY